MSDPGSSRILVVDDEEDVRDLLGRILSETGFLVDTARDGGEAWRRSTASGPTWSCST